MPGWPSARMNIQKGQITPLRLSIYIAHGIHEQLTHLQGRLVISQYKS